MLTTNESEDPTEEETESISSMLKARIERIFRQFSSESNPTGRVQQAFDRSCQNRATNPIYIKLENGNMLCINNPEGDSNNCSDGPQNLHTLCNQFNNDENNCNSVPFCYFDSGGEQSGTTNECKYNPDGLTNYCQELSDENDCNSNFLCSYITEDDESSGECAASCSGTNEDECSEPCEYVSNVTGCVYSNFFPDSGDTTICSVFEEESQTALCNGIPQCQYNDENNSCNQSCENFVGNMIEPFTSTTNSVSGVIYDLGTEINKN